MTIDDFIDCVEKRARYETELRELNEKIQQAAAAHKPGLYQGNSARGSRVLQIVHLAEGVGAHLPTVAFNLNDNRVSQ